MQIVGRRPRNQMIPKLNRLDLETPRTQAELRTWVDELHKQFSQTEEGKRAVRLNEGDFVKKFTEEIWPLALFADAFYNERTDVLFKPMIGNQSYDATIVEWSTFRLLQYLQITQSFDGYQKYLRMFHLDQYGRAPFTGSEIRRDRATGHVAETWPDAVPHEELLRRTFRQILDAVDRKSRMRYEANTSLIIEFEDNHIHSDVDREALDQFARSELVRVAANFAALYLVSDRERLAFGYGNATAAQK
jgi:hypothetical protein